MDQISKAGPETDTPKNTQEGGPEFYCPRCGTPALRPLICGDCASIICRECGTPLERIDDLGIG